MVGVGTSDPNAYNAMMEAVASGSIDQARATAGALAAQLAAQPVSEQPAGDP